MKDQRKINIGSSTVLPHHQLRTQLTTQWKWTPLTSHKYTNYNKRDKRSGLDLVVNKQLLTVSFIVGLAFRKCRYYLSFSKLLLHWCMELLDWRSRTYSNIRARILGEYPLDCRVCSSKRLLDQRDY